MAPCVGPSESAAIRGLLGHRMSRVDAQEVGADGAYLAEAAKVIGQCLPPSHREQDERLLLLYALVLRLKGGGVTPSDVHDAWSTWRLLFDQAHPHILPFSELRGETQSLDEPFAHAIREAHERLVRRPTRHS